MPEIIWQIVAGLLAGALVSVFTNTLLLRRVRHVGALPSRHDQVRLLMRSFSFKTAVDALGMVGLWFALKKIAFIVAAAGGITLLGTAHLYLLLRKEGFRL